jgi:beta-xylosidase
VLSTVNSVKYLVYKVDGNAHGQPTLIYAIQLSADGLSVGGTTALLLRNDQSWEKGIVEGPWFVREGGYYYLFYSGCGYNN